MPTGYTCFIEDGRITDPKDFLKLCLRAFGIMIDERDKSLSLESVLKKNFNIEKDPDYKFYIDQRAKAEKELSEYQELRGADREEAFQKFVKDTEETRDKFIKKLDEAKAKNATYDDFIRRIKAWKCSEDFEGVRKFAIEQCEKSKDSTEWYEEQVEYYNRILDDPRKRFDEITEGKYKILCENLVYYQDKVTNFVKLHMERKDFYDRFMKEVETIE